MQERITTLKMDRKAWMARDLLEVWRQYLQERDRSAGTIKKYIQAVTHFLTWYEQEERVPLTLEALTPIAIIGYRNELQHEQHKSISTINLRISALRVWCGWMTEQGYLAADPAAHVKLIGGEGSSKRSGLKSAQINALLRQAQISREKERNYAVIQVLLQTGIRLSECSALTFEDMIFGERSGFLRLLFPHLIVTDKELRQYCIDPAIRYRQYVRNQLHLMDEEFPAFKLNYELHGLETPLPEEDETETAERNDDLVELAHELASNTSFDNLDQDYN